ncbi:MAG TPA: Sir2 family NAD+-dependent deacetylase [Gammaproteobacteria bacterium]
MTAVSTVVLTGAGISRESGLETFRDLGGVWSQVRLEEVATPAAFARDPARVQAFYNARRRQLRDPAIQPNAAHRALARLEQALGDSLLLVTQNVDDLHERGGSRDVVHMHGELFKARCTACTAVVPWHDDLDAGSRCPQCARPGRLRPHVVWFGEIPHALERIFEALSGCTRFVSIGTSGSVYPAAGFVAAASEAGAATLELNLEPSAGSRRFGEVRHGPATALVPAWVDRLLQGGG